METNTLNKG